MSVEIIHKESLTFKLWEGTKVLLVDFFALLRGTLLKSNVFPDQDGGIEIIPFTVVHLNSEYLNRD